MSRNPRARRTAALWSGLVAAMLAGTAHAGTAILSTGKRISVPPIGTNTNVGSLPMNMTATPDGKYAITSDMGFRQKLSVIRTTDGALTSSLTLGDPTTSPNTDGLYYGLAIQGNNDGTYTVYASRGAAVNPDLSQPGVGVYSLSAAGVLAHTGDITVKHGDFPAGVALSPDGKYLYVANNEFFALKSAPGQKTADTFANLLGPGHLVVYSTTTGVEVGRLDLGGTQFSSFPLAVAAISTNAGPTAYVTGQRDGQVYVVNLSVPASPTLSAMIQTEATDPAFTRPATAHPAGITATRDGSKVYVANAHSDTISVISTANNTVVDTIHLRPTAAPNLPGVSPLGLTLSADAKTLYAALGDMNAVAVISLQGPKGVLQGMIPTGWYPTAVVNAPYRRLLVSNAKGIQARYPNPGYQQFQFNSDPQYDLNQIEGTVELLQNPDSFTLGSETQTVLNNNRIAADTDNPANPLAGIGLAAGKIKHVIYIIKENRTYDQILGDLPQGNGDPAITLFGQNVTPNLHALASRFVLLDNFYDCSEASGDGWPWSTQSIATEYVIKNLPYNYSSRGRQYDFEGTVNNYPVAGIAGPTVGNAVALDPHGNPLVAPGTPFAAGGPAINDVSEAPGRTGASGGHIWDNVRDGGLTWRNYGFFLSGGDGTYTYGLDNNGSFTYSYAPGNIPDNYPASPGLFPVSLVTSSAANPAANDGSDVDFRKYDNAYPDSDAPFYDYTQDAPTDPNRGNFLYPKTVFGYYKQPSRFSEWNREFNLMVAQGKKEGQDDKYVPNFMMVRFHHDHTQGYSAGTHTPRAEVADNDYAVGQLVQAISADPAVWNSTAVFVIEDDSQDGPDHVDVHRSTCYVISPYIKKSSVDHTFYNTDSVLKTMEQLLGLKPMSQYDAVASTILDWDTSPSNAAPYAAALPDKSIIGEVAPKMSQLPAGDPHRKLLAQSAKMDFVHPDSAPEAELNQVIWQSVKGFHTAMPVSRHTVYPVKAVTALKGNAGAKAVKAAVKDDDDD